jgi:hypothetical protein
MKTASYCLLAFSVFMGLLMGSNSHSGVPSAADAVCGKNVLYTILSLRRLSATAAHMYAIGCSLTLATGRNSGIHGLLL